MRKSARRISFWTINFPCSICGIIAFKSTRHVWVVAIDLVECIFIANPMVDANWRDPLSFSSHCCFVEDHVVRLSRIGPNSFDKWAIYFISGILSVACRTLTLAMAISSAREGISYFGVFAKHLFIFKMSDLVAIFLFPAKFNNLPVKNLFKSIKISCILALTSI